MVGLVSGIHVIYMVCSSGNANFENFLNSPFGEKSQNLTFESKIAK